MRFIHLIGPFFYDQSKGQGSEFVVVPILTPPDAAAFHSFNADGADGRGFD